MNPISLIRKKRDGGILSPDEIDFLISSYTKNKIPDYQFASLLMAVFINGLNDEETSALTNSMLNSGITIDLSSVKGSKIDKHSTGGVGDKTSLIIAPIAASIGVNVPMISGRGLGHTGGTLDKLESIPGFRTDLSLDEYIQTVKKCSAVLIGQTADIAPADKLIYSLRDVTATVESIPLITASIMSKKLAEGIDGLVLDVKTGSGAFMSREEDAVKLAEKMISTAKAFDKKVIAFITDMNQPLGSFIGNWLEVYESVKVLKGESHGRLLELSLSLAGAMIWLGNKASSIDEGIKIALQQIKNGEAFNKFKEIVELQNGDISYIDNLDKYPKAKFIEKLSAKDKGYLSAVNNYDVGMAAVELGAGRLKKEDTVDHQAGIIFKKEIGDFIEEGDEIAEIHANDKDKLDKCISKIYNALSIQSEKAEPPVLIKQIIN